MIVTAGKTNVSEYFYIVGDADNAKPGEPVTGLLFSDIETGGSASFVRQGAAKTDLTLITLASASAVHADGGFILVDDTIMPGVYRCDFPDAAYVTGVDQVMFQIVIASGKNAVAAPIKVRITNFDLGAASTPQTADHTAGIADIPTVAEFVARTIVSAAYFDPAADTVVTVTNLSNLPSIPTNWLTAAGINASALDGKGDWNIGKTAYALSSVGLDLIVATATGMVEIAKAVADRVITKANHDIPNSLGKIIRQLRDRSIASDGMAQAGSNNTITLAAGSSSIDNFFKECYISTIGGTGAIQSRLIVAYNGTTKVATVHRDWLVNPDNTTEYITSGNVASSLAMINADQQSLLDLKTFVDDFYNPTTNKIAECSTVSDGAKSSVATEARLSELDDAAGKLVAIADLIQTEVDKIDAARGEPGQGAPPVSVSLLTKIDYLYKIFRNKKEQTTTLLALFDDAGTVIDQKATASDVSGTTTIEEMVSGP